STRWTAGAGSRRGSSRRRWRSSYSYAAARRICATWSSSCTALRKTFPGPSAYPGSEVDRAVHLGDDVAVAARQQVNADEVTGDRRRGLEREALRKRRRRRGLARAAERDVRPPLA